MEVVVQLTDIETYMQDLDLQDQGLGVPRVRPRQWNTKTDHDTRSKTVLTAHFGDYLLKT